jgi:hypothetical protein
MKRRKFLTTLACGGGAAAALAFTYKEELIKQSAEYIAKRKARALFQRFFKVATTFEANPMQMFWFDQYASGQVISFKGSRQTGMTTFMSVLALFESKVHGKSVLITPQSYLMANRVEDIIEQMSWRTGKSVKDGDIIVGLCMHYANDPTPRGFNLQFNMADQGMYNNDRRIPNKYSPSVYDFGTAGFYVLMPKINAPLPKINWHTA